LCLEIAEQKSCCNTIQVFLQTNPHKTEEAQYMRSINIELERASSNTSELIKYALRGPDITFQKDIDTWRQVSWLWIFVPDDKNPSQHVW
jgi:hypothetical protein